MAGSPSDARPGIPSWFASVPKPGSVWICPSALKLAVFPPPAGAENWLHLPPPSWLTYTPDRPTLATNGQPVSEQAGKSISSFAPAIRLRGSAGFWAIAGSFCLFCGNGPACTRFAWLLKFGPVAAAADTRLAVAPIAITAAIRKVDACVLILPPFHSIHGQPPADRVDHSSLQGRAAPE